MKTGRIIGWAIAFGAIGWLVPASLGAGELKVGYAQIDITPSLGVYMPGYFKSREVKGVLDPLSITLLAFSDGKKSAVVAQVDCEAIGNRVIGPMRDQVAAATGLERDAILLHASHTHDGGGLYDPPPKDRACSAGEFYAQLVIRRAADAAKYALADLKPARLSVGWSVAERISFGRRYRMKDGRVMTNPGVGNPEIVEPVGSADDTVQVLRIDREGGKPICVINFQTHPDVVGGEFVTADWPGLTRRVFAAATGNEGLCLVINGTQGDVNHVNVLPRPGEENGLKRDFDGVPRGYEHARHMANVIAGAALSVWMKCERIEAGELRFGSRTVRVPTNKAKETDEKNLAWAERVWALHSSGRDAELPWKDMELTTEVARARRIRSMAGQPDFQEITLSAIAIGSEFAIGGFPGEPFNRIGVDVRQRSPFKMTMLACLTNGSRGYFPFSDSYTQGGYEAATSIFGPSVAEDLTEGQVRLLKDLH